MAIKIVWDAITLKQVMNSAGVVAEQIGLFFNSEGMKLRGLSEHKILMVAADIPASGFTEYQCDDQEISFNVKIAEIKTIIKRIKKTTKTVIMSINEEDSMVVFQFDDKEFTNRLVAPRDARNIPSLPFTAFLEVDYDTLVEILDDASLGDKKDAKYDDTALLVTMNEPKITFYRTTGTTTYKAEREHDGKNWNIFGFGEIKITLMFLTQPVDQISGTTDKIKLSFGQNGVPMMMEVGYVKYFIAPRIEEK